jgi:hypothetical protein
LRATKSVTQSERDNHFSVSGEFGTEQTFGDTKQWRDSYDVKNGSIHCTQYRFIATKNPARPAKRQHEQTKANDFAKGTEFTQCIKQSQRVTQR